MGYSNISEVTILRTSNKDIWGLVKLGGIGFGDRLGFSWFDPVNPNPHDEPLVLLNGKDEHIYVFRLPDPMPIGTYTFKFGLWQQVVDKYNLIDEKIITMDLRRIEDIPLFELPTIPTLPPTEAEVYDVAVQFTADMKPHASFIHTAIGGVVSRGGYSLDKFEFGDFGYDLNIQLTKVGSISITLLLGLIAAAIVAVVGWFIREVRIFKQNVVIEEQVYEDSNDLIQTISDSPDLTPEQKETLIQSIIDGIQIPVENGNGAVAGAVGAVAGALGPGALLLALGAIFLMSKK